ncbi:MAG TPA: glycoside hydrolase family 15 protein [Rhizomicrobium sp.]|nr:glycoside hydrolase family 15 protein [Rhizomicrobium sp.]
MKPQPLDLALIGNGRTAALLDTNARLVWWCYPRFDSDPVFCRLLSGKEEKGFSDVILAELVETKSEYQRNTAIVTTTLIARDGASVRITDFAPRYQNFGRISRPPQLVRIIEPVSGLPRITIRFRPAQNYGEASPRGLMGSNHIRYGDGSRDVIRLTTNAPLSYVEQEAPFALSRPVQLVFGVDEPFPADLESATRELYERTRDYWMEWVRRLSVSYDWQDQIIRAAITLKLSNFEETGAIVAAHTTSIPESPESGRNWDYRFCWLRDAYFVVKALNRIGATRTMEDFISFILSIASHEKADLKPVYGIVHTEELSEVIAPRLDGFMGYGPVRVGNAAALQQQHDAYGSVILAAMPMFYDRRLPRMAGHTLFELLESLGRKAADLALKPDAGIWEYRARSLIHTHSAAMCWAGVNRIAAIATHLGLSDRAAYWEDLSNGIRDTILEQSWHAGRGAFTAAFGIEDLDASVLLLPELGLVDVNDPRFVSTVAAMERELMRGKHVMRYASADDFGLPETAFLVCRYWLIDNLWKQDRKEEAKDLFQDSLQYLNHYGLLSEDVHPKTGQLWGNFPQTYSMAGLILTAMRLSRSWEDKYWHA